MCSASDDILLVSSNAQQQVYQVSVAKDGVGLVGSVSELQGLRSNFEIGGAPLVSQYWGGAQDTFSY